MSGALHGAAIAATADTGVLSSALMQNPVADRYRGMIEPHGEHSTSPERDLRVDFFRGLALMFIYIDHIPDNPFAKLTLARFGFADAAEVFVLLAGYAAFLAYAKSLHADIADGLRRIAARAGTLYLAHMGVLLLCVAGLALATFAFHNPVYFENTHLAPLAADPWPALARTFVLTYQPTYLDILPLYIALFFWLPLMLVLLRVDVGLAIAVSALIWALSNAFGVNFPNHAGTGGWVFNPFAWQLLFTIGAAFAKLSGAPFRSRALFWMAIAYVAFGLIVAAPWTMIPGLSQARLLPDWRPDISRQNLPLWRLMHILALAYIAANLMTPRGPWSRARLSRMLIMCGQHSLPVFSFGIVLALAAFVITVEGGQRTLLHLAVTLGGIGLMALAAWAAARRAGRKHVAAEAPRQDRDGAQGSQVSLSRPAL